MEPAATVKLKGDVYFIYDGECPICSMAAHALRIRDAAGTLHLINAREGKNHSLVQEVTQLGYDLDDGMVIKFGGKYYQGKDALGIMALLSSNIGWFNRINAMLFRSPSMAAFLYPAMRGMRNTLIRVKGVSKLNKRTGTHKQPIFQPIFGESWHKMPPVMHQHYANRPYTRDTVVVEGMMNVHASQLMRLFTPLMKAAGMLVPYQGVQVPTTVTFRSEPDSRAFVFDREFRFPGKIPYHFRSRMLPAGGNEVIEHMSVGIGWRAAYKFKDGKVTLTHRGYVWRVLGYNIPIPLHWLFGQGYAEEEATCGSSFRMHMNIRHPWFGVIYAYSGSFDVKEVKLNA
ncbi:DUF4166 domain-containing protein [bacterium]|nr:DUF4166 domain-containing protein [bacterium]